MNTIKYFLVYIFIICTFSLKAQVFPPDLICIKNDTLVWNLPNNTCGNFNSYQVFASQNLAGPYTSIVTITNPNQTFYVDEGASLQTWYYYLQSDYDCTGQMVLSSDTLDNRLPMVASIEAVSVNGDNIELSWTPSASPEVSAYIIYRNTPTGTIPIDTVFNITRYVDTNAMPNVQEEFYYVLAADDCGNTSIFDIPHHSLLISSEVSACDQSISLNWNPYEGWDTGIGRYEIWVSVNGSVAILAKTIAGNSTNYLYENVDDGVEYCFYITAIKENQPTIFANSNEICQTVDIVQPNRDLFLAGVNVMPNNEVELNWTWASNAEINTYRILRSTDEVNFTEVFSETITPPLSPQNEFVDATATPTASPIFYKIETIDDCNDVATSNTFSTIHLSGNPQSGQVNLLQWSSLEVENGEVTGYELFISKNNVVNSLATLDSSQLSYQDMTELGDVTQANLCYYVEATVLLSLPDSTTLTVRVRSNVVCVEQFAQILSPNAFTPNGKNPEFKPVLFFAEGADYQMVIYDRWGQLLFESTDARIGWQGKGKNGQTLPQGVYVYQIRVTQSSGYVAEKRGTVMLLK